MGELQINSFKIVTIIICYIVELADYSVYCRRTSYHAGTLPVTGYSYSPRPPQPTAAPPGQPHYSNPMFYGPPGYDISLNTGNTSVVAPSTASPMNHGYPGYNIAANTGSAPPVPLPTTSLAHSVPANQSLRMSLAAARKSLMNQGYPGYNIAANTGSAPPVPLPTASLAHSVPAN